MLHETYEKTLKEHKDTTDTLRHKIAKRDQKKKKNTMQTKEEYVI